MAAYRLFIYGKVQGVFYRSSGWIKNLPDGRVEAFAQGEKEQLKKFVEWCQVGPKGASVIDVTVMETSRGTYDNFVIVG